MANTSGKTLLQRHPSFYDHISANHAVQGKVLISVSFLILLLFSVKHTSSRFAVRSVRLNRPRYLGTAAARRLDGLCSLQGCLRCLLVSVLSKLYHSPYLLSQHVCRLSGVSLRDTKTKHFYRSLQNPKFGIPCEDFLRCDRLADFLVRMPRVHPNAYLTLCHLLRRTVGLFSPMLI